MEKFIEQLFLACGGAMARLLRGVIALLRWPLSKGGMTALALVAVLAAGVWFDPTGFFATWKGQLNHFLSQLNFSLSGLVNSVIILAILLGFKPVARIVFPLLDELIESSRQWRDGKSFTTGEGLLMVAYAITTAGIAHAILSLIANMGTPLG